MAQTGSMKWGWVILLAVAGLFFINGVTWFFVGPANSVGEMAERLDMPVEQLAGAHPEVVASQEVETRRVAVYLVTIGSMVLVGASSSLRRGSSGSTAISWIFILSLALIGALGIPGLGFYGVFALVLAGVGLIGGMLITAGSSKASG